MDLNSSQKERYGRHIILSEIGVKGQEKILSGKVLVVGSGGLGSAVTLYLAAAGVGYLGLLDGDKVELSNLQRQVIHFTSDIGKEKVISAGEKVAKINPDVKVSVYAERLTDANISEIIRGWDFIVDCTDNFETRFIINDACVRNAKPFSHGGVLKFAGQTMTYVPGSACYRCVFGDVPSREAALSRSKAGILGAIPGMLGTIQAAEVLKYLTGAGELLTDRLLTFDALKMAFREIKIQKNPNCTVCTERTK